MEPLLMPKYSQAPHLIDGVWHFHTEADRDLFEKFRSELAEKQAADSLKGL